MALLVLSLHYVLELSVLIRNISCKFIFATMVIIPLVCNLPLPRIGAFKYLVNLWFHRLLRYSPLQSGTCSIPFPYLAIINLSLRPPSHRVH